MKRKSPLAPVGHMLDCANWAISYIEGMEKADFLSDRRTQQAVIMNLLVIGEMASRLAREHSEFWEKYPQAPWRDMTSMRNRIAHGYFDLNLDTIWDTVLTSLPELIYSLQPIFAELAARGDASDEPTQD
ncbi:DUF86 domain-containing protein [Methylosinus sp. PW1]|uniref:HepT-like ribonuclease domain-containing protein n=1 Tax=Methylosinus sp. PW1 TaxID=107636 RepID=UPI00055C193F|nr:DUF86 domain-containing protein [Methylosinus sp. PW1]